MSLWSGLSLETHVEWDILSRTSSEIYTRCDWFVAACGLELSWETGHALLAGRKKEASFLFSLSHLSVFWPSIPFFHSLFFSLSLSPCLVSASCCHLIFISSSADSGFFSRWFFCFICLSCVCPLELSSRPSDYFYSVCYMISNWLNTIKAFKNIFKRSSYACFVGSYCVVA